jgi:Asp-tRNA(Asn)/Glu-tRNA(Gln) amidotransferase A subunit family amidase
VSRDAYALAESLRQGRATSIDAVTASLAAIEDRQADVNAITEVFADAALTAARESDARLARGAGGPLEGVPVTVKDHIWMAGVRATNGSLALADFVPAEDCVAVRRLREAGAVIVGKTNNPEFCYRGITDNLVFGLTRNPRDLSRTPGGSSGGAAASVAAGIAHLALGTDGGGSIRIPASFCGVVGHKPTFGLVPKEPGFKGWKSLSVDGPLATSVRDAALMLSVMAGADPADDTTAPVDVGDLVAAAVAPGSLHGLRIAWSADLGFAPVDPDVRSAFADAVATLAALGARVTPAMPATGDPTALWNTIALAEGYASEGPLLAQWRDRMSVGIAALVEAGAHTTAGTYVDALHERNAYAKVWSSFLNDFDVLVTPTMQLTALPVGQLRPETIDGRRIDPFFDDWCTLCLPANLAGLPATSVPAGVDRHGLPIGLQIIGPRWGDALTLRVAASFSHVRPAGAGG